MRYISGMAKAHAEIFEQTVRNPNTGETVIVRGLGSLKGRLVLDESIDLTKPIAAQVFGSVKKRKPARSSPRD